MQKQSQSQWIVFTQQADLRIQDEQQILADYNIIIYF